MANTVNKFGIVVSEFNAEITMPMLENCLRGFKETNISPVVIWVPGAAEIPYACQELILKKHVKCIVALGCIIKGETDHYENISFICSKGISDVSLKHRVPIIFEVLMCKSFKLARRRIIKGYNAAQTAIKMLKYV